METNKHGIKSDTQKIRSDVWFATLAGVFGVMFYGILRITETFLFPEAHPDGKVDLVLSCGACVLMILSMLIFKNRPIIALMSGLIPLVVFIYGAIVTVDFEFFYISMLCMFGIICLYSNFKMILIYLLINLASSVGLFFGVFRQENFPDVSTIVIDALLFVYGSFFLTVLSFRAIQRKSKSDAGLRAFDALLRSTPNMMAIIDNKKKVRYISASFAKFAGMRPENAVGRPFLDLFNEDGVTHMFADILDADDFFEDTREIEAGGEKRYFKIIADTLVDSAESMFIEITDITQTVLMSLRAQDARLEAEHANQSKSQFLATMSHEIRTPMNAIIGIAQIELNNSGTTDAQATAMNKIYASGHNLLAIINDILDLSKIETGKFELNPIVYDLPSLINDTTQLNIVRIGSKPIEFHLEVNEHLPSELFGDELRIKQILNNILSNAFKYTERGAVDMSVTFEQTETKTLVLVFKVRDTGQGLSKEQIAKIFDEYSRFNAEANRGTEGTGLGMSITRRLVAMMDGKLDVESEVGKGSTFTIKLKQGVEENSAPIGKELAEKLTAFKFSGVKQNAEIQFVRVNMPYGKALVVDDVEINLHVAKGLMMPYGLDIDTAASGFDAVRNISEGAVYDVIFMDHMMPGMDGIETVRRLRESGYTKPIVALTANAIVGSAEMFRENGFNDFLSKPIDVRQLNVMLNKYVRDAHPDEQAEQVAVSNEATTPKPDRKMFEIFCGDAAKAAVTLRETADSGNWKLFATTAHAMKSACANVGETDLSERAKQLEAAGKREDAAFVAEHVGALVEALNRFTPPAPEADDPNVQDDTGVLREAFGRVRAALDEFDSSAALDIIAELHKMSWSAATKTLIQDLENATMFSDFDKATALCNVQLTMDR